MGVRRAEKQGRVAKAVLEEVAEKIRVILQGGRVKRGGYVPIFCCEILQILIVNKDPQVPQPFPLFYLLINHWKILETELFLTKSCTAGTLDSLESSLKKLPLQSDALINKPPCSIPVASNNNSICGTSLR